MLKFIRYILIASCVLVLSCKSPNEKENEVSFANKKDLAKAASFNVQLGMGYLKQGNRSRAKKKLLTALKQQPQSPEVNAALGYYFEQTSELEQAKTYYLKAISLSSNSGAQLNNYGTFLCRQGKYAEAEKYFLRAVADMQYVNTAGAYENAGLCSMEIPDLNKAKTYYIKALKQDPGRRESLHELALIYQKEGHPQQALDELQKHPELVLKDSELLMMARDLARRTGNSDLANQYDTYYKTFSINTGMSGVDDEYNNYS